MADVKEAKPVTEKKEKKLEGMRLRPPDLHLS